MDSIETKPSMESTRPEKIDLASAAESQAGLKDAEPVELTPPKRLVDTIMVGDGKLAGDVGFDPLQLADTSKALAWYREAEVKHARLAMLAAVGWPVAEELNGPLSALLGQESFLVGGRAPSLVNGGLDQVSVVYWLLTVGIAVAAESSYLDKQLNVDKSTDYVPGMIGLDPLNMDGPSTRTAEIWLGRIAMIAVTIYAAEELATQAPIIQDTPFLFQPIWTLGGVSQAVNEASTLVNPALGIKETLVDPLMQ
jgi:hypothetical protein